VLTISVLALTRVRMSFVEEQTVKKREMQTPDEREFGGPKAGDRLASLGRIMN
jgi:hypothetical protein